MVEHAAVRLETSSSYDSFGGCPYCGHSSGYMHRGRKRWYFCHTHGTKWCGGEVLHCCWEIEASQEYAEGEAEVDSYREVDPLLPVCSVTVKGRAEMTDSELVQRLRELADLIERSGSGFSA